MKYEWRKADKELYLPKAKPVVIDVGSFSFFMVSGEGNPNGQQFGKAVGALYSLSYAIKMMPKKDITPDGYYDYTVFPLEGVWDLKDDAKHLEYLDKESLIYTIMIRQPDFVTDELAVTTIESVKIKKPNDVLDDVKFSSLSEGLCLQMLHVGSYDDEPESFSKMQKYCDENNLIRVSKVHREIYLSNPGKTVPEKMKTVLRFKVERK